MCGNAGYAPLPRGESTANSRPYRRLRVLGLLMAPLRWVSCCGAVTGAVGRCGLVLKRQGAGEPGLEVQYPGPVGVIAMRAMGFPRSVLTQAGPCSGPKYRVAARAYSGLTSSSSSTLARPRTCSTLCGQALSSMVSATRGSAANAAGARGKSPKAGVINKGTGSPAQINRSAPEQSPRNKIRKRRSTADTCATPAGGISITQRGRPCSGGLGGGRAGSLCWLRASDELGVAGHGLPRPASALGLSRQYSVCCEHAGDQACASWRSQPPAWLATVSRRQCFRPSRTRPRRWRSRKPA